MKQQLLSHVEENLQRTMASRRPASPADAAPAAKRTRRAFNVKFGVDLTVHMAEWWEQQRYGPKRSTDNNFAAARAQKM